LPKYSDKFSFYCLVFSFGKSRVEKRIIICDFWNMLPFDNVLECNKAKRERRKEKENCLRVILYHGRTQGFMPSSDAFPNDLHLLHFQKDWQCNYWNDCAVHLLRLWAASEDCLCHVVQAGYFTIFSAVN
jgi:hypothetical protein